MARWRPDKDERNGVVLLQHRAGSCSMGALIRACVRAPVGTTAAHAQKLSSPPSRRCARTSPEIPQTFTARLVGCGLRA
jgi:hypothetical protein